MKDFRNFESIFNSFFGLFTKDVVYKLAGKLKPRCFSYHSRVVWRRSSFLTIIEHTVRSERAETSKSKLKNHVSFPRRDFTWGCGPFLHSRSTKTVLTINCTSVRRYPRFIYFIVVIDRAIDDDSIDFRGCQRNFGLFAAVITIRSTESSIKLLKIFSFFFFYLDECTLIRSSSPVSNFVRDELAWFFPRLKFPVYAPSDEIRSLLTRNVFAARTTRKCKHEDKKLGNCARAQTPSSPRHS